MACCRAWNSQEHIWLVPESLPISLNALDRHQWLALLIVPNAACPYAADWLGQVRLNRMAEGCKATILLKLESMEPGNSVKDRAARSMIEEAELRGEITPGKPFSHCLR